MSASVVMLGATGAVGNHAALALAADPAVARLTLLGRRPAANVVGATVAQHAIDIFDPTSYGAHVAGHSAAICTLGVGEPSKMSQEEFIRIDHDAVLAFATACRRADVRHFVLLSSVGVDARSRSFFLRTKGRLEESLRALEFERLSLFHPSMILTPTNRYGFSQAVILATWPLLSALLVGPLRKFRGVQASTLGAAMAMSILSPGSGVEVLEWGDFTTLARRTTE